MNTSKKRRQIMGLAFSADWLNHPDRAIPALERTCEAGFGTIIGFVRHMHHTITHEHVRRTVTRTAENCHNLGLKFALAEGLRKELDKPGAYCNDWSRTPRVKWYDYFTRVKAP